MIQLPPGASPVLSFAAAELRRLAPWLKATTVAIGPVDWATSTAGLAPRQGPGHPDGFLLVGDGLHYALGAKSDRGCLSAVYALLTHVGMRWPHPGGAADLTRLVEALPVVNEAVEPAFDLRGTYQTGPTTTDEVLQMIDWSAKRGLNTVRVAEPADLDLPALQSAADQRGITLEVGPLNAIHSAGRCFRHSLGNPYGCRVNKAIFPRIAGHAVAAEPYADVGILGRPANLASVIRQDLEDYFRQSYLTFYLIHNGPISWWTCPLNFDVYARTLWDLNTDPAEALVDFAGGNDLLERRIGQAEEAGAAALCTCTDPVTKAEQVLSSTHLLPPQSLERALHSCDWAGALLALDAMDSHQQGRYGREVLRKRWHNAASR